MNLTRILFFVFLFLIVFSTSKYFFEKSSTSELNKTEKAASIGLFGDYSEYLDGSNTDIVIYTATGCEACIQLKAYMDENKLSYSEFDIYEHLFAKQNMRALGLSKVPVTFTKTKMYVGLTDILERDLLEAK